MFQPRRPLARFAFALVLLLVVFGSVLAVHAYQVRAGATTVNTRKFAGPSGAGPNDGLTPVAGGASIGGPADQGPHDGEAASAASFDGDVRNLPQTGPTDKHAMFEPESAEWERRVTAFQTAPDFVDPVRQAALGALSIPSASQNFKGLDFANFGGGWPPDTNGDVGPNHYIQTVNTSVGIYNKTGTRLAAFSFNSFFTGAAAPCALNNNGDPVALYDAPSGRWIVTDFAWTNIVSGPYYQCIAVSKTADPLAGGWWLYTLRADDATHAWLNDYPKLGVWSDGIYMSANMFDCLTAGCGSATYKGVRVWALNRADMISGAALRSVRFDMSNTAFGALLPSNYRGAAPPAGEPAFFAAIDSPNQFHLWKFHVDWVNTALSTFTGPTNIAVANFAWPSANVPQAGTSVTLDTLGDRLMMQLQYRNLGGVEALWVCHTAASGGVTGVRWYEIRNPNGVASVFQQGTYQPDSNYRWMPSLAVDKAGNMAIGYSVSSASINPQIRYAGRLATDPLGLLSQGEATLIAGTDSQKNTCGTPCTRWGDYSAMTVDPVDDCTFWYTTEYYESGGGASGNWQTRIGSFTYPTCTGAPAPTPTSTPSNTPVPPTATFTRTPTNTPLPPTATFTPTPSNTPVPPTATFTPTPSNTPVPPTATFTPSNTPIPPTATFTSTPSDTPVPPTATFTSTPTNTPVPATATFTSTPSNTPTATVACPNLSAGYCRTDTEARAWVAGSTVTTITGDDQTATLTLPFSVTFFGASYSTIKVSSNGNAHFGPASTAYSNVAIPRTAAPNALIAAFWDDLYPPSGGRLYTAVTGAAPNRVFTIEWRNLSHYPGGANGATFEIQIDESSTGQNNVWILYQDTDFGNAAYNTGISATSGIENAAGSAGNQYSFNQAVLTNNKVLHFWPQ